MSWQPGDEPPVIVPPVRRDPELSIHRERTATAAERAVLDSYERPRPPEHSNARAVAWAFLRATGGFIVGLILAGVAAHAAAHAIMLGWRLIP